MQAKETKHAKPRGTQDVLPADVWKWQAVEKKLQEIAMLYGYKEIRLPTFESTEVFSRGVGGETDIVSKEMYTFEDKGGRSVTLRPEGTSGVVRAVLENGLLAASPMPLKAFYLQSCFRYEKAQKGRLREFHQMGIECFGTHAPSSDAEVIQAGAALLAALGIDEKIVLEINSIGCPNCRPNYQAALKTYFDGHKDKLCDTCLVRLEKNPMRILDCKNESCKEIAANAPLMLDYLCDDCLPHFEEVKTILTEQEIKYIVNPAIVRGLDYYTNTVFEFVSKDVGTQGTVCAGGRYNGLIQQLGGGATPAVGFALGIERMLMAMEAAGSMPEKPSQGPQLYLVSAGEAGGAYVRKLAENLRRNGFYVECDISNRSVKAQMKNASRLEAKLAIVIGDDELQSETATVKNMENGEQETVSLNKMAEFLAENTIKEILN